MAGGAHLTLTSLGYVGWRLWGGRALRLFGAMLMLDGFYIAAATQLGGGGSTPVRFLALVHVMVVALLASYRTAAKLAVWHSLLAVAAFHAQQQGLFDAPAVVEGETAQLAAFIVLTWVAAMGTASFAAMNERELRRRKVDLEDLARMAIRLEAASTPHAVADVLADSLTEAYGFALTAVFAVEGDHLAALSGAKGPPVSLQSVDQVVRMAWDTHTTQLVEIFDPRRDPHLTAALGGRRNVMVVPLFADAKPAGVVIAEHGLRRGSRIERRVVAMTERFAGHAALALGNARLLEQLRRIAATDPLTGIANRRTLEASLGSELERARRTGEPVSLVMVDIDHFKRLNDAHGHQAGDQVLQAVAIALQAECRPYDTVARFGGEEFAIVLAGCAEADARTRADCLRLAVSTADTRRSVTASLGVATLWPADQAHFDTTTVGEQLIRLADAALYQAKAAGRDFVASAPYGLRRPQKAAT